MDARLHQIVLDRIEADDSLGDEAGYFVLAACDGDEALARALGGAADAGAVPPTPPAVVDPPPVYLESITVEGFRGIGPSVRLGLEPGPGLTVIAGRNGSGKSSFAEGLELCLTGSNRRWSDRSKTWQQAWRNLHQEHPVALTAELCVEGVADAVSVERRWEEGADLDDCVVRVRGIPGVDSLDGIGWTGPLVAYRPFLSYNELGDMFEGRPTAFFDAMAGILGIEDLAALAERLRQSRLERDRALREVTDRVPDLRKALDGVDDERARACARALASPTWDLAGLESTLDGVAEEGRPESGRTLLAALAQIDVQPVEVTPAQLTAAADAVAACVATDAGRARRLVALLSAALHEHEIGGDQACPVCASGRLDGDWARATSDQIELLRREAETADQAEREAGRLIEAVRRSMGPVPSVLSRAQAVGVDATAAREAWASWLAVEHDADARALAAHVEETLPRLVAGLATVRASATAELDRREDLWRPVARDLRVWLADARAAAAGARTLPGLKKAENWARAVTDSVRRERFAPIADAATRHWEQLRQTSSVEITGVALRGRSTQRRVDIDVAVDGSASGALGVMSQGELCALSLCLFLPRATLDESPFHFVVVDDPVQSMDPAKVDGLARVLDDVARTRQVVVFTHDDRLRQAIRRLGIEARVIEVTRGDRSAVSVTPMLDPVDARLDDARAASRDAGLPPEITARVVPGLCRQAIEAACASAVRRRRLSRGDSHASVEDHLAAVVGLYQWVALALFDADDKQRQGQVLARLNNGRATFGERAADTFKACNAGAHQPHQGALQRLVDDASRLARALAEP